MKAITEPRKFTADDAWGRSVTQTIQKFEVEAEDVHRRFDHYLGMNHKTVQIGHADVGRVRAVYSSPGHTCWVWDQA